VVSRTGWTRRKRKRSSWGLFEVEVEQVSAATCLGQVEEGGPYFYEMFMLLYRAPSLPQCAGDLGPSGGTWGAASRLTAAALLLQDEMWSVLAGLSKSGWTGRDFAWFFWRRGIPARAWLVWGPLTPWRGKRGGPLYSLAVIGYLFGWQWPLLKAPGPSCAYYPGEFAAFRRGAGTCMQVIYCVGYLHSNISSTSKIYSVFVFSQTGILTGALRIPRATVFVCLLLRQGARPSE